MQDINVSLVQIDQAWEDKAANFALYEAAFAKLPETDLILLPEMFQTAFTMNTAMAEPFSTSESIAWLKEKASKLNAAIFTSLIIEDNGNLYNRGVFVEPNGKLTFYDKRKSFGLAEEDLYFKAGTEKVIVDYLGWKFQLQICYDLRFPEILRNEWNNSNQTASYDVLLFVANWPEKRREHWKTLVKARAIENQSYVLAANRIGADKMDLTYTGESLAIDAVGNEMINMDDKNTVSTVQLSMNQLIEIRAKLPFLKDQMLKYSK
jgi:omega-amidase|tara:strand:+ start:7018 stop:7809 length:792 start_codon:yes stop_codon:yes gene_type:complete